MAYDATKDRFPVTQLAGEPARKAFSITPADSDLSVYAKALYVGTAGDLAVTPVGNSADTSVVFSNVPVGWFPVHVRRVWSTGTTASAIVGVTD